MNVLLRRYGEGDVAYSAKALGEGRRGTGRFLVVRLAGREFGVPAGRIRGMLQMRGLTSHPVDGRGAMKYVAQVQGQVLPVYVPNRVLGLKEIPVSARTSVLLVSDADHEVMPRCAVLVDSISRVVDVPEQAMRTDAIRPTQIRLGEKWRDVLQLEELCAPSRHAVSDNSEGDDEMVGAGALLHVAALERDQVVYLIDSLAEPLKGDL